jgi:hypothetical protein
LRYILVWTWPTSASCPAASIGDSPPSLVDPAFGAHVAPTGAIEPAPRKRGLGRYCQAR